MLTHTHIVTQLMTDAILSFDIHLKVRTYICLCAAALAAVATLMGDTNLSFDRHLQGHTCMHVCIYTYYCVKVPLHHFTETMKHSPNTGARAHTIHYTID